MGELPTEKRDHRDRFLGKGNQVAPWARLMDVIAPQYLSASRSWQPHIWLEKVRLYFTQQRHGLAGEAPKHAIIYGSHALRHFLMSDLVSEATSPIRNWGLLELRNSPQASLVEVNATLNECDLFISKGNLADATLIAAQSSSKSQKQARGPPKRRVRTGVHTGHDSRQLDLHQPACGIAARPGINGLG